MELTSRFFQSRCKNSLTCQQGSAKEKQRERTPQTREDGFTQRWEREVSRRLRGEGSPYGPSAGVEIGAITMENRTEVPPEVKTEPPDDAATSLLGTELREVTSGPGRGPRAPCPPQHCSRRPGREPAARPSVCRQVKMVQDTHARREGRLPCAALRTDREGVTPGEGSQRKSDAA